MKIGKHAYIGLGVVAALGIAMPGFAGGNKYASSEITKTCSDQSGDYGTVVLNGPITLWPPNHKMINEPVTATATNPSGEVTLTLTPAHDEALLGGDGGSQHDPDWNATSDDGKTFVSGPETGATTAAFQVRAERSGQGDGRVYTIDWSAMFGSKKCSSSDSGQTPFTISVPHDMRGGAGWK